MVEEWPCPREAVYVGRELPREAKYVKTFETAHAPL